MRPQEPRTAGIIDLSRFVPKCTFELLQNQKTIYVHLDGGRRSL